ncbi:MAG TPA: hypothetical protein VE954_39835 [Oligoflexus sp.]|uniref:hypothetical protein n=1 Tax=Oligoflexus sp. TaxID=1971216 RepID=UPI002D45216C|nr:hypothetical protein [Oligoflexus sp.]HYX39293.1 hypothetical protein [Oligoflexus sp.]
MVKTLACFLIFFSMLQTHSAALEAAPYALEVQPVRVQADFDGVVKVAYLEPCGAQFAGFVYRVEEGNELKVAVVLRRYHARCMGLLGMQETTLPLIQARNYAAITSMDPNQEPLIVKAAPIQNLHFTRTSVQDLGSASGHAVYTSQCGEARGLLVLPEATGTRFAVLESSTTRPSACNRSTAVYTLDGLDTTHLANFHLMQSPAEEKNPDYSLRRVPVQLLATDAVEPLTKRYQVYYLRRCNEAPIGLVQQNHKNKLQVSMLVAHYPDMACSDDVPKKIWTAFEPGLTVPVQQLAQGLRQGPREDLTLVRPTSFRWNETKTANGRANLEIFTMSTCGRDLGLVSRSNAAGLAVGILQLQSAEPCNSPLKKVSYAYDLELRPQASRDVKPLQLVGT